jgi:hypothetical protein
MAMMFALMQKQHKAQIDAMAMANQKALDLMLEQMNALVAGQGKAVDKENVKQAKSNSGTSTGGTMHKRKMCPHCKKACFPCRR